MIRVVFEHTAGPLAGLRAIAGVWDNQPLPSELDGPITMQGRTVDKVTLAKTAPKWALYRG